MSTRSCPPSAIPPALRWDLFCRVIDNHGDLGVCWRLARQLAADGQTVRLWVDDARALAWMAPGGQAGVVVHPWEAAGQASDCGDVVIEAFGCDLPAAYLATLARCSAERAVPPVWLNLEYLSAEAYVERSHGLPSPQWQGPAQGLRKWFFYPGFTAATGGLLRGSEPATSSEDRAAWLAAQPWAPPPDHALAAVFCYPQPAALAALVAGLAQARPGQPWCWLSAPGAATESLQALSLPPGHVLRPLPWLPQVEWDVLLSMCSLQAVRGEDSFTQAQWSGQALLWHIYAQEDGAHGPKLDAYLDRLLDGEAPDAAANLRSWMRAWNGLATVPGAPPRVDDWAAIQGRWRDRLLRQDGLLTQLQRFVAQARGAATQTG